MSDDHLTATVARIVRPGPGVIRITFVVPGFASCGLADEWVWIFFGEAVRTFLAPAGAGYFWMAGKTRTVRAAHRHLRHERGIERDRYSLVGYWRAGNEGWMDRHEQIADKLGAIGARADAQGADVEDVMDEYDEALDAAGL